MSTKEYLALPDWAAAAAELYPDLLPLIVRYSKRAISVDAGRNRVVFIMPHGYVVKLPRCGEGIGDNNWEASVSNGPNGEGFIQYARTRRADYHGIPIVFMEKVEWLSHKQIVARFGKEPDWVSFVDCQQVGVNRAGKLVAFDYGYN